MDPQSSATYGATAAAFVFGAWGWLQSKRASADLQAAVAGPY